MRSKAKINDEAVISGEKRVSKASRPVLTTDTEKGTFAIKEERGLNDRMDWCRADLVEVWQQAYTWEGLEIRLYVEEYGIDETVIEAMQTEIAQAHRNPELTSPEDTSLDEMKAKAETPETETIATEIDRYYDLNHLRVLRNMLSPLLERLGADDMPHFRKAQLTADLYNVFLEHEEVPTEKEMIVALLDVVDGILSEDIPNA